MEAIFESLSRAIGELLGRSSGPLHFRLVFQPVVAAILAIRAGLRDAREGQPAFLWAVLSNEEARKALLRSGWKDIGKVFILAMVLDAVYQAIALHGFHLLQALIVAIVVAALPYALLRGPVNRIARGSSRKS